MSRPVRHRYVDPLDALWLGVAARVGLRVERVPDAYASTDGRGTLLLSDASGFDPDDSLAQMILHELCHALVQGPESFSHVDWGLDNEGDRDVEREHACLRLQAALLEPLGLRDVLGPTTDYRTFYDALPADPFEERSPSERESIVRARVAWSRRAAAPIGPHLLDGLERTARIFEQLPRGPVPLAASELPPLHDLVRPRAISHPNGLPRHPSSSAPCAECAWFSAKAPPDAKEAPEASHAAPRASGRCRQTAKKVRADEPCCERFEAAFDCPSCGACCREAYDVVIVAKNDPVVRLHPEYLSPTSTGYDLVRRDGRCVALRGGRELPDAPPAIERTASNDPSERPARVRRLPRYVPDEEGFACAIYDGRPKTCRDFTRGSSNCLAARRAVGLSR